MSSPQRCSRAGPSTYVESPDSRVNSPRDNTYLPSVPIHENEPYSSPARNIFYGEVVSQEIKDEIALLAPLMQRCIITHMLGIDVQFCHLLQRATKLAIVRVLEWVSGCRPYQLFLNSRSNVVCLRADIHPFLDNGCLVFLPSPDVLDALDRLVTHNLSCTDWEKRHRYDSGEYNLLLGQTTYTYRVKVLPMMPKNRVLSRVSLEGSKATKFTEGDTFTHFTYPFMEDELQAIESHIHPFFVCAHIGQQIDALLGKLEDDKRVELLKELRKDRDLAFSFRLTEGWFTGEGINAPSEFLNAIPPMPTDANAVDDTSPFNDYGKNAKGKKRARTGPRKANTEPALDPARAKLNPGSKMPILASKARSMPFKLFRLEAPTGALLDQAFKVAWDALTKLGDPLIKLEDLSMNRRTRSATASVASVPASSNISEHSSSSMSSSPCPSEKGKVSQERQRKNSDLDDDRAGIVAGSSGHC
ncbi:hypothetical protein BT96DRAFT_1023784 [Gymnopus androsaceus JB14]|uniref:HNH nuclease domain-containing protein n=1 Tax=Gymnopus androsaceus JB14 TaxID=1447944 RepID=A0A6A4H4I2_9AGAR|nr:hypothetical protein BT96DRAFT_1023784 [Gymnopus androsaceus JB14]